VVCPWWIVLLCNSVRHPFEQCYFRLAVDTGHIVLSSEATQGCDICGLLIVSAPKIPATSLPDLIHAVSRERSYGRATSRTPKKACWLPGNRAVDIRWSCVELGTGWEYRQEGSVMRRKGRTERNKEMEKNKDILCIKCITGQEMRFNCIDVFYCIIAFNTCYGLDGPGIEFRWRRDFPHHIQTGPGAHPASYTVGYWVFPEGKTAEAWLWPPPLI